MLSTEANMGYSIWKNCLYNPDLVLFFKEKMKVNTRLILLNIVLTGAFIFGLNFLSNVILGLTEGFRKIQSHTTVDLNADPRANLPNYFNQTELAKIHFKELDKIRVEYKAFVGWSSKPFQGRTIEIDSDGDRLHQNKRFGKHSDRSAYLFGGSTIWGLGTANEETIPALFNSISGMPTFNKGEQGFTGHQSLVRLIEIINNEKNIDVIIFYDGVNDVSNLCRTESNVNDHGWTALIKSKLEADSRKTSNFFEYLDFMFLRGTQTLVSKINRKVFQHALKDESMNDESMNCDNNKEKARQIAESMVKNWEIARDLAESRGILFRAILQPVAFIGTPKLDHIQNLAPSEKELAKQYKTVYPIMQEIIQKRGHDWILDYTNMFSRDEYNIYIDFCHVSKNGNLIIAQQIYSDISSALD